MFSALRSVIFTAAFFLVSAKAFTQAPAISILNLKAPEHFRAEFVTTKGRFVIEAFRSWSPKGVDRLYQLISSGYFTDNLVFRMEPGFVTQFGISPRKAVNRFWVPRKIPDEPALRKNTRGTIAFARDFANSRYTQLFINLADNPKLDTVIRYSVKGYTPIGRVISGMDVISGFNGKYLKQPAEIQDSLYRYGNAYFEKKFPGLDRILSARVLP